MAAIVSGIKRNHSINCTAKNATEQDAGHKVAALAPLREKVFFRTWSACFISNFAQFILGVGVAWEMTRLTSSPAMVELVQTAMMLPLMLVALPAGAIADVFDRRKIALPGLGIASFFGSTRSVLGFQLRETINSPVAPYPRTFDLDYLRAEIAEDLAAERPCQDPA